MSKRLVDMKLLRDALAVDELPDKAREAFADMLSQLRERKIKGLTDKQRRWAKEMIGEPEYENLVTAGKVPRGREVPTPPMLRRENLPMKPPGRRHES